MPVSDTTTSSGRLVFHIFGAIADFERQLIRERPQAGLKAVRGRRGGRPPVITERELRVAREMLTDGQDTMQQIADTVGVGRVTFYPHLELGTRAAAASSLPLRVRLLARRGGERPTARPAMIEHRGKGTEARYDNKYCRRRFGGKATNQSSETKEV